MGIIFLGVTNTAQIQLPHSVEPTTMVSEFLNHNCKGELF